ncbi:MAG TPA: T9SS type A sorting domain-containing protein, partial [Marinilabiliaceae bacterium]|nr:T9SS type A sorting domain-containing protein [Marinilabiliaceae bacterium]
YMQAETTIENIDFEEWNEYGHPIATTSTTKMGETIVEYTEYSYNNTYDGALRTSTITSFREEQDGDFVPVEKIEYAYGANTSTPNETISTVRVFPTVFDVGFNVQLAQASSLKLISAQGQTIWQQALTTGTLFVPGNHLPQGFYILLISTDTGGTETIKLIKR